MTYTFKEKLFSGVPMKKSSKNFTVSFEYIGEGFDGDYDHCNHYDKPLLRCDIKHNKNLEEVLHNGSFCTNIATNVKESELIKLIQKILDDAEFLLIKYGKDNLGSVSSQLQSYSWYESNEEGLVNNSLEILL